MSALILALSAQLLAAVQQTGASPDRPPPPIAVPAPPIEGYTTQALPPPVDVRAEDFSIPPSTSVLAATFATLRDPPANAVSIKLTCAVNAREGVPIVCFPADAVGAPTTLADFHRRGAAFLVSPPGITEADERSQQLFEAATDRILSTRLHKDLTASENPPTRFRTFEVVFSPDDAMSVDKNSAAPLAISDIRFEKGFDAGLLQDLYPPPAMLSQISAQVALTCRIRADRTLFCGDDATVEPRSGGTIEPWLKRHFLLATYQAAATVRVAAKTTKGAEAAGQSVKLVLVWQKQSDVGAASDNEGAASDHMKPTSLLRRERMDSARINALDLPAAPLLPRQEALATLYDTLTLRRRIMFAHDVDLVGAASGSGNSSKFEAKYPGFLAAVTATAQNRALEAFERRRNELILVLENGLRTVDDAQLSSLAASSRPMIDLMLPLLAKARSGTKLGDVDTLLDSADARHRKDIGMFYLHRLAADPNGMKALEAFASTMRLARTRMGQITDLAICEAMPAIASAATTYLMKRGAGAEARIMELSAAARQASGGCSNPVPTLSDQADNGSDH